MKHTFIILLLLALTASFVQAARPMKDDDTPVLVAGCAFQAVTHQRLAEVYAELLTTDSTRVDSMTTSENIHVGLLRGPWMFRLDKHGLSRPYIVRLSKPGYETVCIDIPVGKWKRNKENLKLYPNAEMSYAGKSQTLGEATVTATKVVFYNRGDTLVFNADALNTPDGSSLDAIIRQLPGVELKEGGEITVNGRKVEKLMLNGKDFFNNDNKLMLENLPAIMVKHIDVYEETSDIDKALKNEDAEKAYVMDVKLKRQYQTGYIVNAEGGGGTEHRYLGRLFAMRFTPRTQLTAVGNVNNLNDSRRPGQDTEWSPDKMPAGALTTRMGGLDFNFDNSYNRMKVRADFKVENTDAFNVANQSSENFLTSGNTFGRSFSTYRSKTTRYDFSHQFEKTFEDKAMFVHHINADYRRVRSLNNLASATFTDNPDHYLPASASLLDTLQSPAASQLLRRLAVNRVLSARKQNSDTWNASGSATAVFIKSNIALELSGQYSGEKERSFEHYRLDYPTGGGNTDYRNRYNQTPSSYDAMMRVNALRFFSNLFVKGLNLKANYTFTQNFSEKDYNRHRLERLAGWDETGSADHPLGMLPSEEEWLKNITLDERNSYFQKSRPMSNRFNLEFTYRKKRPNSDRTHYALRFHAPADVKTQRLDYRRYTYDRSTRRTDVLFEPYAWFEYNLPTFGDEGNHSFSVSYEMTQRAPSLDSHLLDYRDDADPLNISTGNPGLHKESQHAFAARYYRRNRKKQTYLTLIFNHRLTQHAIAYGFTYNPLTGVRHYRPENVEGNNETRLNVMYGTPLDSEKKRLHFEGSTQLLLSHYADLMTTDDGTTELAVPQKSMVNTLWATQHAQLSYKLNKFTLRATGYVGYNRAASARPGFTTQNVWTYDYGLSGQAELFWKLQLSTDLKMYSHRGFAEAAANTDYLVWNARLSRAFPKQGLTLIIDGFDLLRQIKNRSFTMSTSGRVETYRNALPSYFMMHAGWRLNRQPKRQ